MSSNTIGVDSIKSCLVLASVGYSPCFHMTSFAENICMSVSDKLYLFAILYINIALRYINKAKTIEPCHLSKITSFFPNVGELNDPLLNHTFSSLWILCITYDPCNENAVFQVCAYRI